MNENGKEARITELERRTEKLDVKLNEVVETMHKLLGAVGVVRWMLGGGILFLILEIYVFKTHL